MTLIQCNASLAGKCPANEEFSSCAQGICRAENCTQKGRPIPCPDIEEGSCEERCVCVEGTLRDANGTCIPEDKCPGKPSQKDIFISSTLAFKSLDKGMPM